VKPGRELEHYPHYDSVPSVSHDKCSVIKTDFAGKPCILKVSFPNIESFWLRTRFMYSHSNGSKRRGRGTEITNVYFSCKAKNAALRIDVLARFHSRDTTTGAFPGID